MIGEFHRPRRWLVSGMLVVCSAALLATSPPDDTSSYTFERLGIDGGRVELTRDRPTVSVFVVIRADALGPDQVSSTDSARVALQGVVTHETDDASFVRVKLVTPSSGTIGTQDVLTHFENETALSFDGNCADPTTGDACQARFQLDFSLVDESEAATPVLID
jgi:hypothetical protein